MRWNRSCAVQRFIQSALACTCLALIPFSGCTSKSSRNFSLGLRKEASRSAQIAEDEVATRKRREAAIAARQEVTSREQPHEQVAERSGARKSPIAGMFERDEPQTRDPFAGETSRPGAADSVVAQRKSPVDRTIQQTGDSLVVAEKSGGTRTQPATGAAETPWDQLMRDYLAEEETAGKAPRPETAMAARQNSARADQTSAAAQRELPAWARQNETTPNRVVGPEPPTDWTRAAESTPVAATPARHKLTPQTEQATPPAQEEAAGIARLSRADLQGAHTVAGQPGQPSTRGNLPIAATGNGRDTQAAKLRVKSLMSDSHSDMIRGDWNSAYRHALQAQQEAEERQVRLGANEEHPNQLVNEIANRLWGNPNARPNLDADSGTIAQVSQQEIQRPTSPRSNGSSTPTQGAVRTGNQRTIVPAQGARTSRSNNADVFGGFGVSEWTPVDGQAVFQEAAPATRIHNEARSPEPWSAEPTATEANGPQLPASRDPWTSQRSPSNELPVIRARDSWQDEANSQASVRVAEGIETAGRIELANAESPAAATWDAYLANNGSERASLARPATIEDAAPPQHVWAQGNLPNPVVVEAAVPSLELVQPATTLATSMLQNSSPAALTVDSTQAGSRGNFAWAIGGFLAALAATIIGLRSRRQDA